jgi:hypothetical protein
MKNTKALLDASEEDRLFKLNAEKTKYLFMSLYQTT